MPKKCKKSVKKCFFSFFWTKIIVFIIITICFGDSKLQASNQLKDSLINTLKTAKEDTNKVNTLNDVSRQYQGTGDFTEALYYAEKSLELAQKLNYSMGIGNAFSSRGGILWYLGENEKSIENHVKASHIRKECGDIQGLANSYNNIGLVYLNLGNYEKCLENHLKALKIREEIGDKSGTAGSYNNIGILYLRQGMYDKALENYEKALVLRIKIGDKVGQGMTYNNIGLVYIEKNDMREALKNLLKGLVIREELGDKKGMADSYLNIGGVYYGQKKYEKALEFFFKAAGMNERIGIKRGMGVSYVNIGDCFLYQNKLDDALLYLNKGATLLKEINSKDGIKDAYAALSEVYHQRGDYKKAFEFQSLYADLKDTLFNEQVSEQITEMNTKYESEKKDKELIKKEAELSKQQVESEKQVWLRNTFIIGFILISILAFFIFREYNLKQKANKLLDEKNEKITDSINYAKRIQEAIFTPIQNIKESIPESFIFLQPKDIVSGDFYWFANLQEKNNLSDSNKESKLMLAAIDCTGHGVPGAFMSLMAYNLIETIVKKQNIHQPAEVLNLLSKQVARSLKENEYKEQMTDGMDIALVQLTVNEQAENNKPFFSKLEYAGAHNPLYIIRKGQLIEIKADKKSIGLFTDESYQFTNHSITLEKDDCCYLFSDGFPDQFGEVSNEKFYYQPFRELLISINHLSMTEQRIALEKNFIKWKGKKSQTDDVLIIGFRA
jgi:serine phosphatase RsbU (regulator of sigma subunit)/Tfp pilus assembly protein PilF